PTVTPPAGPNGFEPQIDTTNPDLSHDTQVDVSGGALTKMNRFATIALDSILSNPADIVGLTASAVDPLLDPYIKIYNNTFTYGTPPTTIGDGKLSLVCEWYPLTQGERNAMNNGLTSITYNGSYTHMYVTTDIILTNAAGTQSATVTVTFVFAHSNMTLIP
ncbi:MAG: hypothetical protein FWH26_07390, partial [Oscillospiraceae bacterium]|nr:hypothetical protein [Oscillospiraceae bacterium]